MGKKAQYDSAETNIITVNDKIINRDAIVKYDFVRDSLYAVGVGFPVYDSTIVTNIFLQLKPLLFEKYGLCVSAFDEYRGMVQYKLGELKRIREIVWGFNKTVIVLSIDRSEVGTYIISLNYFAGEYFSKRAEGWKDKL